MWGIVLCCFAGVKNFQGAVAVRFFLGVFEAAVTPGFALFTSQVRLFLSQRQLASLIFCSGTPKRSRVLVLGYGSASMGSRRYSVGWWLTGSQGVLVCMDRLLRRGKSSSW